MRQHGLCHSHSTCIKLLHLGPVISARLGIKTSLLIKKVTNCVKNLEISFIGFFFCNCLHWNGNNDINRDERVSSIELFLTSYFFTQLNMYEMSLLTKFPIMES